MSRAARWLAALAAAGAMATVTAGLAPGPGAHGLDPGSALAAGTARPAAVTVLGAGAVVSRPRLRYRSRRVELVPARPLRAVVPAGLASTVVVTGVPKDLAGPLPAGARVGSVGVLAGGRIIARVALVTRSAIRGASLGQRLADYLRRPLTLVLLAVLLGCSLQLALLRRRATRRRRGHGNREPASA